MRVQQQQSPARLARVTSQRPVGGQRIVLPRREGPCVHGHSVGYRPEHGHDEFVGQQIKEGEIARLTPGNTRTHCTGGIVARKTKKRIKKRKRTSPIKTGPKEGTVTLSFISPLSAHNQRLRPLSGCRLAFWHLAPPTHARRRGGTQCQSPTTRIPQRPYGAVRPRRRSIRRAGHPHHRPGAQTLDARARSIRTQCAPRPRAKENRHKTNEKHRKTGTRV